MASVGSALTSTCGTDDTSNFAASNAYDTCVDHHLSTWLGHLLIPDLAALVIGVLYVWLMIGLNGATVGMIAASVRAVRTDNGQRPGLGMSALRYIVATVANTVILLGFLSVFFDGSASRRTWYDKASRTQVVHTP